MVDFNYDRGQTESGELLAGPFERSESFRYLKSNATRHGFEMSYGKKNFQGIAYEPWHWRYIGQGAEDICKRSGKASTRGSDIFEFATEIKCAVGENEIPSFCETLKQINGVR